jgi:hypothetical protein
VTAGADDQQIGGRRLLDERLRRAALLDARLDDDGGLLAELLLDDLHQVLGSPLARVGHVVLRHRDAAGRWQEGVLPDVQDDEFGVVIRGLSGSPGQRLAAAG